MVALILNDLSLIWRDSHPLPNSLIEEFCKKMMTLLEFKLAEFSFFSKLEQKFQQRSHYMSWAGFSVKETD